MYNLSNQFVPKQLGLYTPNDTSAHSIYQPPSRGQAIIHTITIANTSNSGTTFRIFIDINGTTYDTTTAIAYDEAINANTTVIFEIVNGKAMFSSSGNLAVRTGASNALTFIVDGLEKVTT